MPLSPVQTPQCKHALTSSTSFAEDLEVGSAVALFFPRQAFYGAVLLSVSLVGHIFIHAAVLHHPAAFLVFLLAITLLIAYLRRPLANA